MVRNMTTHEPKKYEKVAATAATLLEKKLVLPTFFTHQAAEDYKGGLTAVDGDEIFTITVPGVLNADDYDWRSGQRGTPNYNGGKRKAIEFHEYKETKVEVGFQGRLVQAVEVSDEQKDFDLKPTGAFGRMVNAQTDALARKAEARASALVKGADFDIQVAVKAGTDIRTLARAARRALNKAHVPAGERILLLGLDWEEAALADDALAMASAVGERRALAALERAVIGALYGLTIVVTDEIPDDAAYAFVRSAFVAVSGVASMPQGITGAAARADSPLGLGLRFLQSYDHSHFAEQASFDLFYGVKEVRDPALVIVDDDGEARVAQRAGKDNGYFLRAVEIVTDTVVKPEIRVADEDLAEFMRVEAFEADD